MNAYLEKIKMQNKDILVRKIIFIKYFPIFNKKLLSLIVNNSTFFK